MADPKWSESTNWKVTLGRDYSSCAELEAEIESLRRELKEVRPRSEAWFAVVSVLNEITPGFLLGAGSGEVCAVNAIRKLKEQLADSQEHAQAEQDRADSHWNKVEDWQDKVRELKEQLAEIHRAWQESCNDAFEKAKQLADLQAQLASLQEVARAAKNQRQWQTISETFDEALSSHESKWGKLEKER